MTDPTPVQLERATLIEAEIVEVVGNWLAEGVEPQEAIAALATAAANTIILAYGHAAVAPWFAAMAANAQATLGGNH